MTGRAATAGIRERLRSIVGADAFVDDLRPWYVRGVAPHVVLAPASPERAAAALGACSAEGWTVECAGAGTWLRQGRTPAAVDVVLTSSHMTGVTEYEPADLTIGLCTGTSLEDAASTTAGHGQYVPLDGAARPGATIGAMLATATPGALRAAHGAPRDQALGLQVVTGDGRVLRFGGRVVKNVAGYDVVRLLVGSHGTLGLITAAHLRLRARPERDATLRATDPERAPVLEAARAAAAIGAEALEIVHGAAGAEDVWTLFARVRGQTEAVADATARLCAAAPSLSVLEFRSADASWARIAHAESDASVVVRARTLPASVHDTLDAVAPLVAPGWTTAVHAHDGTVRLLAAPDAQWNAGDAARFAAAVEAARAALRAAGGTLTVPVPPPGTGTDFDPYAVDDRQLALMRALKRSFDPEGILAPGRFVL